MTAVATPAAGVVRGCGPSRVMGGAYAVCHLSPNGRPLEDFLLDPPWRIDLDSLGVTDRGVQLLPDLATGAYHLYDVVGQESYPNVADVLEEGRAHGFSRRLPRTLDWSKVTRQSRLMLIHRRAWIVNHADYYQAIRRDGFLASGWSCPKHKDEHRLDAGREMCLGLAWYDVEGGVLTGPGVCARRVGDTLYGAHPRPVGVAGYQPAIFLALPLTAIEVVADPATGSHQQTAKQAQRAGVPVRVVTS